MRNIIISDIHGSFYTMKKLLNEVNFKDDKEEGIMRVYYESR